MVYQNVCLREEMVYLHVCEKSCLTRVCSKKWFPDRTDLFANLGKSLAQSMLEEMVYTGL